MLHRFLFAALVVGFVAVAATPCHAQAIYINPSNIDYDDYGQGYYGGFGRRTNGLFPGSHTAFGNSINGFNPNSSSRFPRYRANFGGAPIYRDYSYTRPSTPPPNYGQTYSPYGFSPYSYNPYSGW